MTWAAAGRRDKVVTVTNPGAAVPDGDGGYTQAYSPGTPAQWFVAIQPATAADLERTAAGTVLSQASHIITGAYRSDVSTASRLEYGARTFYVRGVANPDEANIDTVLICEEVVS